MLPKEDLKLNTICTASNLISSVIIPYRKYIHKDSPIQASRHISTYLTPKYTEQETVSIIEHVIDGVKVYQFVPKQVTNLDEILKNDVSSSTSSSSFSRSSTSTSHNLSENLKNGEKEEKTPENSQKIKKLPQLPTMFYYHGGAFSYYSVIKEYKNLIAKLSKLLNIQIFSPEYHLAPEHPYPRQFQDCFFTTVHILRNNLKYKVDLENFTICGDSAGGQLTCAISYKLAERNEFKPKLIAPLYPALQTVYVKQLPSQRGVGTRKKLLTTTSTTKAVLTMTGHDGFNPKYQKYMKRGYHLPVDSLNDTKFMRTISPKLYLDQEKFGSAEEIDVSDIKKFQNQNQQNQQKNAPRNFSTNFISKKFQISKNFSKKPKPSEIKEFQIFTQKMKTLINDPIFNIGCISDEKLSYFITRGPKKYIFSIADCDPLRDEAIIFSKRLECFGADIKYKVDKGMPHGYFSIAGILGGYLKEYDRYVIEWLREVNEIVHDFKSFGELENEYKESFEGIGGEGCFRAEVVVLK